MAPFLALVLSSLVLLPATPAADERLGVGSAAPPLSIENWIKGEPVHELQRGKVYLVEFWATWCKPCIEGFEHLSQLQEKWPDDLVVICVSDEPDDLVVPFLDKPKIAEETRFRITNDTDRSMHRTWLEPARQPGLPTAFIVDREGIIQYVGHTTGMDYALERVVTGREPDPSSYESPELAQMLEVDGVHSATAIEALRRLKRALGDAGGAVAFEQSLVLKDALKMGGPDGESMDMKVTREGRLVGGGEFGWRQESSRLMAIPGFPGGGMKEEETLLIVGDRLIVKRASGSPFQPPPLPGDGWYEISRQEAARFASEAIQPLPIRFLMDPNPELSSPLAALSVLIEMTALDVVPTAEGEEDDGRIVLVGKGAPFVGMPAEQGEGKPPQPDVRLEFARDVTGPVTLTVGDPAEPLLVMTLTREPLDTPPDASRFTTGDEGIESLRPVLQQMLEQARSMRMQTGAGG